MRILYDSPPFTTSHSTLHVQCLPSCMPPSPTSPLLTLIPKLGSSFVSYLVYCLLSSLLMIWLCVADTYAYIPLSLPLVLLNIHMYLDSAFLANEN